MTYIKILAQLPPELAQQLQVLIDGCVVSAQPTEDEVREIIDGAVHQFRATVLVHDDEVKRDVDQLLEKVTDAVCAVIFS